MAKITKNKLKLHNEALDLVRSDKELTFAEKEFILENYKPYANHNVTATNAFFTPIELAMAATIEMPTPDECSQPVRILDLCAGVGMLSFAYKHYSGYDTRDVELVCVELEEEYVEVGKRILPEATWINASIMDEELIESLGQFDCFISNPPFMKLGPYKGTYTTSAIGLKQSRYGVVIVPQCNCPFEYSGKNQYTEVYNRDYKTFSDFTDIRYSASCIDTESIDDLKWDNVNVTTEVVIVEKLTENHGVPA
jgi:type I restriction-modification system DNA methylase subunit